MFKLTQGWEVTCTLLSLAELAPDGSLQSVRPFEPPKQHQFTFEPDGDLSKVEFVFNALTLEQFAFLVRLVQLTEPQPPHCLRPTPWRAES